MLQLGAGVAFFHVSQQQHQIYMPDRKFQQLWHGAHSQIQQQHQTNISDTSQQQHWYSLYGQIQQQHQFNMPHNKQQQQISAGHDQLQQQHQGNMQDLHPKQDWQRTLGSHNGQHSSALDHRQQKQNSNTGQPFHIALKQVSDVQIWVKACQGRLKITQNPGTLCLARVCQPQHSHLDFYSAQPTAIQSSLPYLPLGLQRVF